MQIDIKEDSKKKKKGDIREWIPHDLKKILGKKKCIFLLHLNEFNLKDGFENYTVTKIFYVPSNDKKVWKKINTQPKIPLWVLYEM